MGKQVGSRVYWRNQGGARRAWGDFRDFADVGGKREALVAPGERRATTEPRQAEAAMARRLEELRGLREGKAGDVRLVSMDIAELVRRHLITLSTKRQVERSWIEASQVFLARAIEFFGPTRSMHAIRPKHVMDWETALGGIVTNRKKPLSQQSIRHHLNALSRLFRRAQELDVVREGYNPVAKVLVKPQGTDDEADFLESHEAAALLEAVRSMSNSPRNRLKGLTAEALLAVFLLTGARETEVYGLELSDISFERETIRFRWNRWRRIKNKTSSRVIRMWPQLKEILLPYVEVRSKLPGSLLFPSFVRGEEQMLTDIRGFLDRVASEVGLEDGRLRTRIFRHTYCAARLQTLDRGEPIGMFTVSRELGHASEDTARRIYAHLGEIRHRSEVVEFRLTTHPLASRHLRLEGRYSA